MNQKADERFMARALALARLASGRTSPNPLVGAVVVRKGRVIGEGYHKRAGEPHAEIEAIRNSQEQGNKVAGATLFVTLEPCSTFGRTPPCTEAILASGVRRVVVGTEDPNPKHAGRGLEILRDAGLEVELGVRESECTALNKAFNHWIVHGRPYVTVKAAMTLDGKIATARGESKWITGPQARHAGMALRHESDGILVGVNTILADNPSLTVRSPGEVAKPIKRFVLDRLARTPLTAKVLNDDQAVHTTLFVGADAPKAKVRALSTFVNVIVLEAKAGKLCLRQALNVLSEMQITHLLVEGGGEVNASFLEAGLVQRIAFFYAPKILGGAGARKGVAGTGLPHDGIIQLENPQWDQLGPDLLLTATVCPLQKTRKRHWQKGNGMLIKASASTGSGQKHCSG